MLDGKHYSSGGRKALHRDKNAMSAGEHLAELRRRSLVWFAFLVCTIVLEFCFSDSIMGAVFRIAQDAGFELVYIAPQESVVQELRVLAWIAFGVSLPVGIYEIVCFVAPVFSDGQVLRRVRQFAFLALVMAVAGIMAAFLFIGPVVMKFLFLFSAGGGVGISISVEKYISLFLTIVICLGIMFQIPTVCAVLVMAGVISMEQLRSRSVRGVYFIGTAVASAVLTPPDPVTLLAVMLPMWALYPLSLFMCKFFRKEKQDDEKCKES